MPIGTPNCGCPEDICDKICEIIKKLFICNLIIIIFSLPIFLLVIGLKRGDTIGFLLILLSILIFMVLICFIIWLFKDCIYYDVKNVDGNLSNYITNIYLKDFIGVIKNINEAGIKEILIGSIIETFSVDVKDFKSLYHSLKQQGYDLCYYNNSFYWVNGGKLGNIDKSGSFSFNCNHYFHLQDYYYHDSFL